MEIPLEGIHDNFFCSLMRCGYRDVSLLTSVHPSQLSTISYDFVFTGSKDALFIQKSALKLSMNAKMCDPYPICSMIIYMVPSDARNPRRFTLSFPCHAKVIHHRHASPLLLYPPIPYSQASDHSVTDGLTKPMLLIGPPLGGDML